MSRKLNAVIAIAKGTKARVYGEVTELHKQAQKSEPFSGLSRKYRKLGEDGEDLPSENKKVQLYAEDVLVRLAKLQSEAFDIEAEMTFGNQGATADVVVDGTTVLKAAPATYLIYLEKQLTDVRTFVDKMPTLDESEDWEKDANSNVFKTATTSTHRTKKVQKPIVLFPATPEHPAQTQLVTEDIIAGYWDTIKLSGALPVPRKQAVLGRIDKLLKAVKTAREAANEAAVETKDVGSAIFGFLFA